MQVEDFGATLDVTKYEVTHNNVIQDGLDSQTSTLSDSPRLGDLEGSNAGRYFWAAEFGPESNCL